MMNGSMPMMIMNHRHRPVFSGYCSNTYLDTSISTSALITMLSLDSEYPVRNIKEKRIANLVFNVVALLMFCPIFRILD